MLKIYGFQTFNLGKVLLTTEELGLAYELIPLNPRIGDLKSPDNLKRHPLGKMPNIEWNGFTLFESNAICKFLADKMTLLYGSSLEDKALINQWIDFMGYHVGRHLSLHYFEQVIRPRYYNVDSDHKVIEESLAFLKDQLPVLESHFENNSFFVREFSIADIIAFSYFHVHERSGYPLTQFPNLYSWYQEIRARESFSRAIRHFQDGMLTI